MLVGNGISEKVSWMQHPAPGRPQSFRSGYVDLPSLDFVHGPPFALSLYTVLWAFSFQVGNLISSGCFLTFTYPESPQEPWDSLRPEVGP